MRKKQQGKRGTLNLNVTNIQMWRLLEKKSIIRAILQEF
jgi:hypothetical protein